MRRVGDTIRVLYVESDNNFAETVSIFLEENYERFIQLSERSFHCILSEYNLPSETGSNLPKLPRIDIPNCHLLFSPMTAVRMSLEGRSQPALPTIFETNA